MSFLTRNFPPSHHRRPRIFPTLVLHGGMSSLAPATTNTSWTLGTKPNKTSLTFLRPLTLVQHANPKLLLLLTVSDQLNRCPRCHLRYLHQFPICRLALILTWSLPFRPATSQVSALQVLWFSLQTLISNPLMMDC